MKNDATKKIILNGLMIALVFLATYFTKIPTPLPGGYFNLGDSVIMVAAILLGRNAGLAAGAIGSCLADIALGSFLFAPFTFVVKGLEGYVTGVIGYSGQSVRSVPARRSIVAVIAGAIVMVGGYFVSEAFILGFFDSAFGRTCCRARLARRRAI
jgi:uncharacterized membrane protein